MAVPTLRAVQRAARDGMVLWGPGASARLLAACGLRAAALPYRRSPGFGGASDVARGVKDLAQLGARGVLLLPNAFEPALMSWLARIPRRVGYATEGRGFLLSEPVKPLPSLPPAHEADRYSALLSALDLPAPGPHDARLQVPAGAAEQVRAQLGPGSLLTLVPGCSNAPAKRWPAESFAALADSAAAQLGARTVLVGSAGDREVAARVRAMARSRVVDLTGRTDLRQLAGVLAESRVVVSNDTGAAHLAAALSRPTLVIYGPTDPRRTRPRGSSVRIASIGAFCQPCESHLCPLDHRCMQGLSAELALEALTDMWKHAGELTVRSGDA